MKKIKLLVLQLVLITFISLILGALNNLRPSGLDWWKLWSPLKAEGEVNRVQEENEFDEWEGLDPDSLSMEIDAFFSNLVEITPIGLKKAVKIHQNAFQETVWIDARTPKLFEEGHIEGAYNCDVNADTRAPIQDIVGLLPSLNARAIIIYCKGAECTDSKYLSDELKSNNFNNILIYEGGFDLWYEKGHPVGGSLASVPPENRKPLATIKKNKPKGMYLEHLLIDMVPVLMALLLLIFWKKARLSKRTVLIASLGIGLFFVYASFPKVIKPILFAKAIWNYDLVFGHAINPLAIFIPVLELVAACCVIFGFWRRGGSFVIGSLLVIYMIAVSFNVFRGHEFQCGCTPESTFVTNVFIQGINDKVTLLVRDLALLFMSILVFKFSDPSDTIAKVS